MIRVLALMGPTACGKSSLAIDLAEEMGREIISADSRQVYRGLRIGTAQPSDAENSRALHHLVDFLPLDQQYSAQRFVDDALGLIRSASDSTASAAGLPIVVGGTGFYLRSLWQGLFKLDADPAELASARAELETSATEDLAARLRREDPETAEHLHPNDRQRILRALEVLDVTGRPLSEHHRSGNSYPADIEWVRVLLTPERSVLRERIASRTGHMLQDGWLEETQALIAGGADPSCFGLQALGYPELRGVLRGEKSLAEAEEEIITRTCQYARRQEIWFRREQVEARLDPLAPDTPRRLRELMGD